jgi:hypothetical protein
MKANIKKQNKQNLNLLIMKIIKRIFLVLLVIVAIVLIIAFFLPKNYAVEREIAINHPKDSVFKYIKFIKNQDNYSTWSKKDPNSKKTYTGTDGTVGFISAWNSQNKDVGVGEQEILKITEGDRLDLAIRFKISFESNDEAYMITESISPSQTKVKWGFKGKMPYPMNLMIPVMNMEKMLGDELNIGLENLKSILEKK